MIKFIGLLSPVFIAFPAVSNNIQFISLGVAIQNETVPETEAQSVVSPETIDEPVKEDVLKSGPFLPKGTQFLVTPLENLSSQTQIEGTKIPIKVVFDVLQDGEVFIPRGTKGFAEITYVKGKGSFGKKGKLTLTFRELFIADNQILPLSGSYEKKGSSNTNNAIATSAIAGPLGALIKGTSAKIEVGAQLVASSAADLYKE